VILPVFLILFNLKFKNVNY